MPARATGESQFFEKLAFTSNTPNIRKRGRMIGLYNAREIAGRLEAHKAKLESKNYLKGVGRVYSIREESGGLGDRPNESDKNNQMHEKIQYAKL